MSWKIMQTRLHLETGARIRYLTKAETWPNDRNGAQTYFLSDGLGSTANLTDGARTTTASYSYDIFGAMHVGVRRVRR